MRKLIPVLLVALTLFCVRQARSQQTAFIGVGPTYSLPLDTFDISNQAAFGGSIVYASRKYCNIWPSLRISYTYNTARDTLLLRPYYTDEIVVAPEVRYFFVPAVDFPLYVSGAIQLSSIHSSDSSTLTGLGASVGAGYLLFYDNNCCNWFLDLNARYEAPNIFLRSEQRPVLTSVVLGLSFNISL